MSGEPEDGRVRSGWKWAALVVVLAAIGAIVRLSADEEPPKTNAAPASSPAASPLGAPSSAGSSSVAGSGAGAGEAAGYVGSSRCRDCHREQHDGWARSDHARAMGEASAATGSFDGSEVRSHGRVTRLSKKDGQPHVTFVDESGAAEEHEVRYTFGYAPLEQYLVPLEDGRLQVLPVSWDTGGKRWFSMLGDKDAPPGSPLHWRSHSANWNAMCASCHSTDVRKGYDADKDRYDTRWSEISVGCEACHGPGERHARWAERPDRSGDPGLTPMPRRDKEIDLVAVCGPCHSRRQAITEHASFGEPYLDHFVPELLREGQYFPDGQILDEVFVLGSFLQSRMHREAVVCTSCHDPHTGALVAEENKLCVRCHAPERFDTPKHHFHPTEGSAGARCVACHMPERTYMVVDPRRDHALRIPRPDLSEQLGTPNACNQCHTDRSPRWAAEAIAKVHPDAAARPNIGVAIAAGRAGKPEAVPQLLALASDRGEGAIVRATALELLSAYPPAPEIHEVVVDCLRAEEPLVRLSAVDATAAWPPAERVERLSPLLSDALRSVRIQAARALVDAGEHARRGPNSGAFRRALDEYVAAQRANIDHPGGRLNLGSLEAAMGDPAGAERHYRAALKLSPAYVPAAVNLAELLERRKARAEAVNVLEDVLSKVPDASEAHYALGLLLAADKRYLEAARHVKIAVEARPVQERWRRNYDKIRDRLSVPERATLDSPASPR
ncbi:MAG: cytochrome c3 family protein [Polyangiaceae bacterium]